MDKRALIFTLLIVAVIAFLFVGQQPKEKTENPALKNFQKSDSYYKSKEFDKALEAIDKTIEHEPGFADAWTNRGVILAELGRHEEALESYEKASELNPRSAQPWYNKGVTLEKIGRTDEAIAAYGRASSLKPNSPHPYYNMARLYAITGDAERSMIDLSKAVTLDSSYVDIAKNDPSFSSLKDDERFKSIVK